MIYIEKDKANSLLLMEPIIPGAYQRALEKRGPGLHHQGFRVEDIGHAVYHKQHELILSK